VLVGQASSNIIAQLLSTESWGRLGDQQLQHSKKW